MSPSRAAVVGIVLALLVSLSPTPATGAAGPGCMPAPLPSGPAPGTPTFSMNVERFGDKATLTVWRAICVDSPDLVFLMRVLPTAGQPFMCGPSFHIVQAGLQFDVRLLQSSSSTSGFCDDVLVPATFLIGRFPVGEVVVDNLKALTLLYEGYVNDEKIFSLEIPAAGPTAPPPPTVTVVATGCTTCHSGGIVAYHMAFNNPGAPFVAEVKGGARFPDGSILPLVNTVTTIPSGASTLALVPSQALPAGLPTIDLGIEAAILEPALGVTLSRHNVPLKLSP